MKLSNPQNQALSLLEEAPKTAEELAKAMGWARFRQVHLEDLRRADYIELEAGKWQIKR